MVSSYDIHTLGYGQPIKSAKYTMKKGTIIHFDLFSNGKLFARPFQKISDNEYKEFPFIDENNMEFEIKPATSLSPGGYQKIVRLYTLTLLQKEALLGTMQDRNVEFIHNDGIRISSLLYRKAF